MMRLPRLLGSNIAAAVLVVAATAIVYRQAAIAFFIEDDLHWLAEARRFQWANLLDLAQYDHFYRPLIEIYFYIGHRIAGCAPLPFHLASIAIHLLNTSVLFAFARELTRDARFAWMTVVLFVLQPGYGEAVVWVAAITDLLPALWYLLTLLLHLRFLRYGGRRTQIATIAAFAACLLTHESSATLLPMMIALEALQSLEGDRLPWLRWQGGVSYYIPFAILLALFLVVAYVVNSRSYLIREGYYTVGPHAVVNAFNYVVALYVGKRTVLDYILIAAALGALLVRGTARLRFLTIWVALTLLPVLFFTWGIASRYLYVPAAGFAMLLADLLTRAEAALGRRMSVRAARAITATVAVALAVRFAAFAEERAADFRTVTAPYARFAEAIRASYPSAPSDRIVVVPSDIGRAIPDLYRDAAAETALCAADVRVSLQ
jgi:hypothetical protein